jgi:hypothetical protein
MPQVVKLKKNCVDAYKHVLCLHKMISEYCLRPQASDLKSAIDKGSEYSGPTSLSGASPTIFGRYTAEEDYDLV